MLQIEEEEVAMERHVRLLGIFFTIWGGFSILCGFGVTILLVGAGVMTGEATGMTILAVVALFFGGFLVVTGALEIICGWGLMNQKSWARTMAIVLAILNIIDPPLGTALGVYALWVLFNPESQVVLAAA